MAGLGLLHRIHREHPNRVDAELIQFIHVGTSIDQEYKY
jgi:hypothetical protein